MGDMFLPFRRFLDFSGRSRRREYWLFLLLYTVVMIVAVVLDIQFELGGTYSGISSVGDGSVEFSFDINFGPLEIGAMLLFLLPLVAVTIRRMHDVDKSGWFMWVPMYNLVLTCFDGTPGPNRFGPDPKGDPRSQIFS